MSVGFWLAMSGGLLGSRVVMVGLRFAFNKGVQQHMQYLWHTSVLQYCERSIHIEKLWRSANLNVGLQSLQMLLLF